MVYFERWYILSREKSPFDVEEWGDFDEKDNNLNYSLLFSDMLTSSLKLEKNGYS